MMFRRWLGLIVICVSVGLTLAQGTGRIEGRLVNDGKGVSGVAALVNETKGIVISDKDGRFVVEGLAAGNYTLIFTLQENTLTRIVTVKEGETTSLDLEVDWALAAYEEVRVTAGQRRAEKIVDAPAAITQVTQEEIEREASHGQLPKVLEYTPGAEVTQSGLYDFNFNTRGFNSSLNRRVSTYIDGRDVGVPLLGAQEWAAMSIPLDDLAGLEFIRGPSAALYGANASSGVVRMTTKAPAESEGGMLRTTAGELDTLSLDFRWADAFDNGWAYKLTGGFRSSGDFTVTRDSDGPGPDGIPNTNDDIGPDLIQGTSDDLLPEYSRYCANVGEIDCLPRERPLLGDSLDRIGRSINEIEFATVRVDKTLGGGSRLTLETGDTSVSGPAFQTGIGRVQIVQASRPWARFAYSHPHWNVLAHWASREAEQENLAAGLEIDFDLITDTVRYGVEMQTNWNFAGDKGRFVFGAAYTEENIDSTDDYGTGGQTVVRERIKSDRQAVFSQFDYTFNDHFKLVFAGRLDWNTLHDLQFSPKGAAVYSFSPKHSVRLTFNRAFQVANYSEFFLDTRISVYPLLGFAQAICSAGLFIPGVTGSSDASCLGITDNAPILAVGNNDLQLENTESWEIGYSGILGTRAFVTLDYYKSKNEDFITDLVPQIGTSLGNPINPDYIPWVAVDSAGVPLPAESEIFFVDAFAGPVTVAQALRNTTLQSVGNRPFGFDLAQDLDGTTILVGRTYTNVGEVDTQGVDLGLQFFFNDRWNVQASYSWFDFDIIDAASDVNEILLPNSPEHKASMSVSYRKDRWEIGLAGRWVDDFRWSAGVFQGDVSAYTTSDFNASYAFRDDFKLGINAANLFDNVHRQTFGGDLLSRRALAHLTYYW